MLRALAQHLTAQGLAAYSDYDASDVFLSMQPDSPDALVALFTLPGGTADRSGVSDEVQVRVVVRGAPDDVLGASAKADAIYQALRDKTWQVWGTPGEDGVRVTRVMADPPYDNGRDRLGRNMQVIRLRVRYQRA